MSGQEVVDAARRWIGTPYVHQASVRGGGTDCLGLLRGVWREVIGPEPVAVPPYSADWAEPGRDEVLLRTARRLLCERPRRAPAAGDILVFRMREGSVAKHLGIVSAVGAHLQFIHAYSGHAVVESPLSDPWQRRIAACFQFPARRN